MADLFEAAAPGRWAGRASGLIHTAGYHARAGKAAPQGCTEFLGAKGRERPFGNPAVAPPPPALSPGRRSTVYRTPRILV